MTFCAKITECLSTFTPKVLKNSSDVDEIIRQLVILDDELLLISILAVDFLFFLPSAGGRPRPAPATFFVIDFAAMIPRASVSLGG